MSIRFANGPWTFAAASVLSIALLGAGPVTPKPDPIHGRQLAERLCSNCHLVGTDQQTEAQADVPSFREISNKQAQTAGDIMARIMLPNHPMPQIPLKKSEITDLSAYILSLKEEREP